MANDTLVNSQVMEKLHKYFVPLITILGQRVFELGSSILMKQLVIAVFAYFGSLGVMILQTDPEFGEFMNKISILFGSLAVTLELLILVPPFGWLVFFSWSICFVMIATKSYQYLKILYQTEGAFDQLKELFSSGGPLTENEAQDQNQIINELPV